MLTISRYILDHLSTVFTTGSVCLEVGLYICVYISVDGFTLAGPLVSGFGNRYQLHRCYFVYFYTAVSQRGQYHGSLTQIEDSDQNTGRETGYLTG